MANNDKKKVTADLFLPQEHQAKSLTFVNIAVAVTKNLPILTCQISIDPFVLPQNVTICKNSASAHAFQFFDTVLSDRSKWHLFQRS